MGGTRTGRACYGALIAAALGHAALLGCDTGAADEGGGGSGPCTAGQVQACACGDGTTATQTCRADGLGYLGCACPIPGGQAPPLMIGAQMPIGGSMATVPPPPAAGAGGVMAVPPPPVAGMAGTTPVAGASGIAGTPPAGAGGTSGASGAGSGGTAGVGTGGSTASDDLEEVRQICVDYINMYRATLSLPALTRGTMAQETCSDEGAKKDGDSGQAHSSAGDCQGLGGQDTCPGWGIGGFSGNATLGDALTSCLDQMWAEGPPPVPDDQCIADYQNCFLKHGHYMNMSGDYGVVACGFYEMSDGKWWMNQNFGR